MGKKEEFTLEGPTFLVKDGKAVQYPAGSDNAPKASKYEAPEPVKGNAAQQ
jgi:hypothetical protein